MLVAQGRSDVTFFKLHVDCICFCGGHCLHGCLHFDIFCFCAAFMVLYVARIWSLGVIQIQAVRYLLPLPNFRVCILNVAFISVPNSYIPSGLSCC